MKIYNVIYASAYQGEINATEVIPCATEDIAKRNFKNSVSDELDNSCLTDENDEEYSQEELDAMTLEEKFARAAENYDRVSMSDTEFSISTLEDNQTIIKIEEYELVES